MARTSTMSYGTRTAWRRAKCRAQVPTRGCHATHESTLVDENHPGSAFREKLAHARRSRHVAEFSRSLTSYSFRCADSRVADSARPFRPMEALPEGTAGLDPRAAPFSYHGEGGGSTKGRGIIRAISRESLRSVRSFMKLLIASVGNSRWSRSDRVTL